MKIVKQIQTGDFVKLDLENSPTMRVERVLTTRALCFWFDKKHRPHERAFNLTHLKLIARK